MAGPGGRQLGETLTQYDAGTASDPLDTDHWWNPGDQVDQQIQNYAKIMPKDPAATAEVDRFDNQIANAQVWPGKRLKHSEDPQTGFAAPNYNPRVDPINFSPEVQKGRDFALQAAAHGHSWDDISGYLKGQGYSQQDVNGVAQSMAPPQRKQLHEIFAGMGGS